MSYSEVAAHGAILSILVKNSRLSCICSDIASMMNVASLHASSLTINTNSSLARTICTCKNGATHTFAAVVRSSSLSGISSFVKPASILFLERLPNQLSRQAKNKDPLYSFRERIGNRYSHPTPQSGGCYARPHRPCSNNCQAVGGVACLRHIAS